MGIISMLLLFVKQLSFIVARSLRATRAYALSQVFPHVLDPPPAAHMGEPNQVQRRTLVGIIRKTKLSDCMKRKDPPSRAGLSFHGIRRRPTLPGRLQPSTIGAERLNFCVRYGNRWTLSVINTNLLTFVSLLRTVLIILRAAPNVNTFFKKI